MIIPFFIPHAACPHRCIFCDQKKITGQNRTAGPRLLPGTILEYLKTKPGDDPVQAAFYGGTFTALPAGVQKGYLDAVRPFIESGRVQSIRVSTRPDCIDPHVLSFLKDNRVETIELGVQSMDDRVLMRAERGHCAADTIRAAELLKRYAIRFGLQLLPGLPEDSFDSFIATVDQCIALRPDFVRIYPALVIKDTRLEQLYRSGRFRPLPLEEAVSWCKHALVKFSGHGIEVIRVGLQATEELEKEGTIAAGPYHPAFRQVVESSVLLDRMRTALRERSNDSTEQLFLVSPRDLSNAIGQKRMNIAALKEEFGLQKIVIKPDSRITRGAVRLG